MAREKMERESMVGEDALGNMGNAPVWLRFIRRTPGNWFIEGDEVLFTEELADWFIDNGFCEAVERYGIDANNCYVLIGE